MGEKVAAGGEELCDHFFRGTHLMLPINHPQHFLDTYPKGRSYHYEEAEVSSSVICLRSHSSPVVSSSAHTLNSIAHRRGGFTRSHVPPGQWARPLPSRTCPFSCPQVFPPSPPPIPSGARTTSFPVGMRREAPGLCGQGRGPPGGPWVPAQGAPLPQLRRPGAAFQGAARGLGEVLPVGREVQLPE